MNNFKKLLASAMALTMVTSVLPMNVHAAYPTSVTTMNEAETFLGKFEDALSAAGLSIDTLQAGEKITFNGDPVEVFNWSTNSGYELDASIKSIIASVVNLTVYKSESYYAAVRIQNLDDALDAMVVYNESSDESLVKKVEDLLTGDTFNAADEMLTISGYAEALKIKDAFAKYEQYEGNLVPEGKKSEANNNCYSYEEYMTAKENLNEAIEFFEAANYGDTLDGYLTDLENLYEEFVEHETTTGNKQITKVEVDALLKGIKNSTDAYTYEGETYEHLTKNNYSVFQEDEGVVSLLEMFESLATDYEDVRDAISKQNDAYVAYTKDKIYGETVKDYVTENGFWTVYYNLTDEQWEVLKTYKEEVLDVIFTLDAKQVGNTYVEKSEKSAYISDSELKSVLDILSTGGSKETNTDTDADEVNPNTKDYGLFNFYDKDENIRYWDLLETHMEGLDDALKAVTDDIAGLTPATIKGSDRELLEAAEDAIYELTANPEVSNAEGGYADNLTSAQQRIVKQADTKITNLREAFDDLGIVDVNDKDWWQYENGQWVFYQDGKTVSNVWVADINNNWFYAGANGVMLTNSWIARDSSLQVWYYVGADGKMVTNTVVDGCTIDANGEWHA